MKIRFRDIISKPSDFGVYAKLQKLLGFINSDLKVVFSWQFYRGVLGLPIINNLKRYDIFLLKREDTYSDF